MAKKSPDVFVIAFSLILLAAAVPVTTFNLGFNGAKALFVVAYLIVSLGTGVLSLTFQGLNFVVDIHLFLVIAMLLGLVGLAKSVLQTIHYLNEKAELTLASPQ